MKHLGIAAAALAAAATCMALSSPVLADANNQAYVDARSGSNSNAGAGCPVTAPCADVNTALSVISANGSVNILVGGVFGPVVLSQAISIHGTAQPVDSVFTANPSAQVGCVGHLPGSCGLTNNGYAVEIAAGTNDIVKLGYVTMNTGTGTGAIKVTSGNVAHLPHDIFRGNNTTTGAIVSIAPGGSAHTEVYMSNGDIAFNRNGGAVLVAPTGTNNARLHFNHMEVHHANFGIKTDSRGMTGPASSNSVNTFVSESEFFSFSGSAVTAVSSAGTGGVTSIYNDVNVLNSGGPAVQANGPGSIVILTNSTLGGNQSGVNIVGGAVLYTSQNNTIKGNGVDVTGTLTPAPLQ